MTEMLEIEIKSWCDDLEAVAEGLAAEGAVLSEIRNEVDVYFNHPARNFAETDEALRIRSVNGKCRLTYKGPKLSERSKARVEHETEAGDFNTLKSIIENLGFTASGIIEKKRSLYKIGDIEICLDAVEGLGTFVEIEKAGLLGTGVEEELYRLAAKLGLSRFERRSYLELKYFP